jgi:hypothetical protein
VKDCNLKDGHPSKESEFEEKQRQKVGSCSAVQYFRSVFACHRGDGIVLENDAERNRKCKIWGKLFEKRSVKVKTYCNTLTDQVLRPQSAAIDRGVCAVDQPLSNDVPNHASSTAMANGDSDCGKHRPVATTVGMTVMAVLIFQSVI